jgi:ferredoxin--NADP+ reductase
MEAILGSKLNPEKTHVYLCGNPAMIGAPFKHLETGVRTYPKPEGIIELLESRGFNADLGHGHAPGNIHFEEYWS